jgi:hypothetical protein
MTQDKINQMVEQAGFNGMLSIGVVMDSKQIKAFAKLVAAKTFQDGYEKGVAAFNEAVLIERTQGEDYRAMYLKVRDELTELQQRTEQEPWCMKMNRCKTKCKDCPEKVPQRTWVGLTEQERNDIEDYCEMMIGKPAFDAIEAKLKEKNT